MRLKGDRASAAAKTGAERALITAGVSKVDRVFGRLVGSVFVGAGAGHLAGASTEAGSPGEFSTLSTALSFTRCL